MIYTVILTGRHEKNQIHLYIEKQQKARALYSQNLK